MGLHNVKTEKLVFVTILSLKKLLEEGQKAFTVEKSTKLAKEQNAGAFLEHMDGELNKSTASTFRRNWCI